MSGRRGIRRRRVPTGGRPSVAVAAGVALLGLLLVAGCTEHGAMPTRPGPATDDLGGWQRIYPAITNQNLRALWGLDADDMWAVGDRGTILHYDGRQVRRFAADKRANLVAIDGCARDEAWAVSQDGHILRWDGRHWQLVQRLLAILTTVCNPAPGEVFVGGRSLQEETYGAAIWHLTGGHWQLEQRNGLYDYHEILRVWSPGDGRPLLAASPSHVWRYDEGMWHRSGYHWSFRDADGELVLADSPPADSFREFVVYRADALGDLAELCAPRANLASRLVRSRSLVIDLNQRLYRFDSCMLTPLYHTAQSLNDLAVPALAGRHGPHVFAVGLSARFLRLTWQADQSMTGADLVPATENRRVRTIASDTRDLFIVDDRGDLFRREAAQWREISMPYSASTISSLASGALAICSDWGSPYRFSILPRGGEWQELPPFDLSYVCWWIDDALRPRILRWDTSRNAWELWGLENEAWVRLLDSIDDLPALVFIRAFIGFAPDDLYLAIVTDDDTTPSLFHYDGASVRPVLPERDLFINNVHAGSYTGRLYLSASDNEYVCFSGYLQDGLLTVLDPSATPGAIVELGADLVLQRTDDGRLFRLGMAGWHELRVPNDEAVVAIAGHPDCGVFILTYENVVYHQDLGGEAP